MPSNLNSTQNSINTSLTPGPCKKNKKAAREGFRATSLSLVGATRFELVTSCSQGRRATRLRYAPAVPVEMSAVDLRSCRKIVPEQPIPVKKGTRTTEVRMFREVV